MTKTNLTQSINKNLENFIVETEYAIDLIQDNILYKKKNGQKQHI